VSDDDSGELLRELAGHLQPVFENLDGGVYLYLDARHKVCNEQLATMYGRTVEEWSSVEEFQETFVADEDRPVYCDIYGRTIRTSGRITRRPSRRAPLRCW
jgi:PAS domain-containing protein